MDNKYFDYICNKIYENIKNKGFSKEAKENQVDFFSDIISYKVEHDINKKRINLLKSSGKYNEKSYIVVSEWMMNEEDFTQKDADMICEDFTETIVGIEKKIKVQVKSKTSNDDGNVDTIFMANRMVNIFPELKRELVIERECYDSFRAVNFIRNNVLPKIKLLLEKDKSKTKKLFKQLSDLYNTGNMDVRSIITIVILNSLDEEKVMNLSKDSMSDELKNAWKAALKFKGKKVKPEKLKKQSTFISKTLSSMN